MAEPTHLVIFDADRIKDFVFATGRLKEIRGGSQLVRDGSDAEQLKENLGLTDEEIVFAEGGAGVLQFTERERAEEKARALERFYRTVTHGATLTAVVQSAASFREAKQAGDRRLRMAKEDRRRRWQTAHSPFSRACESCGARPAVMNYEPSGVPLCEWCYAKRTRSDDA
ncbi:MAG: hypothetical protein D6704_02665, partial [Nitrospirae bacterium]